MLTDAAAVSCDRASPGRRLAMSAQRGCLIAEGKVYCWSGDPAALAEPLIEHLSALVLPAEATDVAVSDHLACVVLVDGRVECWGSNPFGQLGAGSRALSSEAPLGVVGISRACTVAVADDHACAVERSGGVRCWGDNTWGQCGSEKQYAPAVRQLVRAEEVAEVAGAERVTVANNASCVLWGGRALCWGAILETADATRTVDNHARPTELAPFGVTSMSMAFSCGCALWQDGQVGCFGVGRYGCSGRDPLVAIDRLSSLSGARRLEVGPNDACAEVDRGWVCWRHPESPSEAPRTLSEEHIYAPGPVRVLDALDGEELRIGAAPCVRSGNLLRCWPVEAWSRGETGAPRAMRIE
jgi:hypothetical protein